jgi:polyisoprenoid-binding protein YceI
MKTLPMTLALLVTLSATFGQTMFKVVPGHENTAIQFRSEATMETVTGTTHTATGYIEFDPSSRGENARGEIHVDLASIRTGIELRDRHMRENQLETDKYPEAIFVLTSLLFPEGGLPEGLRTRVIVKGNLTLHGAKRAIEPETYITVKQTPSGTVANIESKFTVKLADYDIHRPQFLLMRLAEEQHMTIQLHAVSGDGVAEAR